MKKVLITALAATTCMMTMNAQPKLSATNIDEVIKAMTLEEKAKLLVGGANNFFGDQAVVGGEADLVAGAAGTSPAIPRLGIPATVLTDGPAGVRIDPTRKGTDKTFYATAFPIGSCLASTWNTDLVSKVGEAIGNETKEYRCDVILGPGMNLHRNPLCGRNFEYYSEDPLTNVYRSVPLASSTCAASRLPSARVSLGRSWPPTTKSITSSLWATTTS